jgi:DNA-binding transcriptional regulator YdaS (Cro superfamily)
MLSNKEIKCLQKKELDRLLAWVGSRKRLADELGVTRQAVFDWIKRGRISASMAIEVEKRTDGLFTKESLRPDVVKWVK